jgi:ABC-type sulfate transport system permease component
MAARPQRLDSGFSDGSLPASAWPGLLIAAAIALLIIGTFTALLVEIEPAGVTGALGDPYLWRVVRFTLLQAGLSTLVSLLPAILLARALARRTRFPGRTLLVRLLGLPMVIPVIVAVFGIVAIFGQAGLANRIGAMLGLESQTYLYGLSGILIGHAFFNLPLATRFLLPAWSGVPGETWRLAAQLGMNGGAIFRLIEWPLLRERIPGAAAIVFMLCMTSFAVVLTLGGGPAATTVEVAIYQPCVSISIHRVPPCWRWPSSCYRLSFCWRRSDGRAYSISWPHRGGLPTVRIWRGGWGSPWMRRQSLLRPCSFCCHWPPLYRRGSHRQHLRSGAISGFGRQLVAVWLLH